MCRKVIYFGKLEDLSKSSCKLQAVVFLKTKFPFRESMQPKMKMYMLMKMKNEIIRTFNSEAALCDIKGVVLD